MVTDSSIGLVHDYLLVLRGAERTFAVMADHYTSAPIYTLLYDQEGTQGRFAGRAITTSYLGRLRVEQGEFRRLLPLFPRATEQLPVSGHDVVLSSSSAFAHGVRVAEGATHVCYCHTPFRYAWFEEDRAVAELPSLLSPALRAVLRRHRRWDERISGGVTRYLANSEITRERIRRYLHRDAVIVHPPVDVDRFRQGSAGPNFLVVCELLRHKQVDLALAAARRVGARVDVVGSGPDRERLEALYGGTAIFHGRASDDELVDLYAGARALIVPNVEEFGIAAVEAQAAGRPVIAADAGGARETVVDGGTGVRFPAGDADALAEALSAVDYERFDPERCRAQAERFSVDKFRRKIAVQVDAAVGSLGQAPVGV